MARKKRRVKKRTQRRTTRRIVEPAPLPKTRYAPLNTAFMVSGIIGFLISAIYLPKYSMPWAFAFGFVFFLMFIAAMLSMARAAPDSQLMLTAHKKRR